MHPVPRPHRRPRDRRLRFLTALGVLATLVTGYLAVLTASPATAAPVLLSQGRPATASSSEGAAMGAGAAVDGNTGTRWSSAFSDPQWIQVDLGSAQAISQVVLNWEAAYGRAFTLATSTNGTTWTTIHTTTTGTGGVQTIPVTGNGRYVRMNGTARGTAYGYSLWEFQIYGETTTNPDPTCGTTNAAQGRPATASSTENAATPAGAAVDGNTGTRWASRVLRPAVAPRRPRRHRRPSAASS